MSDDEIYCIPTYMVNQKVKNYTRNLIQFLKENNKQVLLISHHFIPVDFQEIVDYCIYDNRNHLLHENKYKGWMAHRNNLFYVESQEFFPCNSTLACYYFHSSLFFSKFLNKRIVHFVDYDSILSNLDQYDENYQMLKNSEYSSIRYKNEAGAFFADTCSLDLSKLNLDNFIVSEEKLKSLIESNRTYEVLFEHYFKKFENIYWKSFKELKKSTVAGLEHINSIDWICLAANKEDNKFYLTIVNPSDEKKKHKIIADGNILESHTHNSSWVLEVSDYKNVIVYDEKGDLLKTYHVPNFNIKDQSAVSWLTFNPNGTQLGG
jgi:hypothetical protein